MTLATPTLTTARLQLRPFDDSDADDLFDLMSDSVVLRYWDSPAWTGPSRAAAFIAKCHEIADEGSGARCAVQLADDESFIGWCSATQWNHTHRTAVLSYCFAKSHWGQGFATEAADAVVTWAFDALALNRLETQTDTRNAASAHVLEKLGFTREGTLRENCIVNGEVSDSWVYALLACDRTN